MRVKYPRTPHLPWSVSKTSDDITLSHIHHFEQLKDIVVTEKLDGENTTLYRNHIHARSLDSKGHHSRDWIKRLHAEIRFDIPDGFRICGENVFAKHSIFYDKLTTYFYAFAIFEGNVCLSWAETVEWCKLLNLEIVPVLYRGKWNEVAIKACWMGTSTFGPEQEGYVVRNAQRFAFPDFSKNVAKYVRSNHVSTDNHWMYQTITRNKQVDDNLQNIPYPEDKVG